jgi:hypothetical protein
MNQSIEDASRRELLNVLKDAQTVGLINERQEQYDFESADDFIDALVSFRAIQAARQSSQSEPVATADYIAYLYSDGNKLKIAEEMPPPDNAFPVFTTNIRFLDVARLVLSDNVDLILEHGGVKLWEALITEVNKNYAEINHEQ